MIEGIFHIIKALFALLKVDVNRQSPSFLFNLYEKFLLDLSIGPSIIGKIIEKKSLTYCMDANSIINLSI